MPCIERGLIWYLKNANVVTGVEPFDFHLWMFVSKLSCCMNGLRDLKSRLQIISYQDVELITVLNLMTHCSLREEWYPVRELNP